MATTGLAPGVICRGQETEQEQTAISDSAEANSEVSQSGSPNLEALVRMSMWKRR